MADELPIRIPSLPMGKIVEENGFPTDDELTFRQGLIGRLQTLFGTEGAVLPSLKTTQIDSIVANTNTQGQYTCAFGTLFYDTDLKEIWATVEDPVITGKPIKKKII